MSVLAVFFTLQLRAPGSHRVSREQLAVATTAPTKAPADGDTCWDAFAAPFAAHTGVEASEVSNAREEILAERITHIHDWTRARFGRPVAIEVMIATVPDPSEAALRTPYTKLLASVTAGVEASAPGRMPLGHPGAFQRDREWLPWDEGTGVGARPALGRCGEEWPGVRLFRGADADPPRLLALLLVGETPVAGVYARAMSRAFEISRALQKSWRSRSPFALLEPPVLAPVGVLGPTLASSVLSLRQAIDGQRRKGFREPVDVMAAAELGLEAAQVLRRPTFGVADPTRYTTTAAPPGAAECALLHFARDHGAHTRDDADGVARVEGVAFVTGRADMRDDSDDGVEPVLARSLARCGLNAELDLTLQLEPLSADGTEGELRPSAGPRESTTSALDEIARRGIRWVGVRTGVSSVAIAMSNQLRERAPRARVAFLTHDRELVQPDVRSAVTGALLVTPHPLLGERDLTSPMAPARDFDFARRRSAFPDAAAVAVFNAARALRGTPPEQLVEYAVPSAEADLSGTASEALPFWIASLGAGGLTALDLLPTLDCERTLLGAVEVEDPRCGGLLPGEQRDEAERTFRYDHRMQYDARGPVGALRGLQLALYMLAALAVAHRWHVERQRRALFPKGREAARTLDGKALTARWQLHATVAQFGLVLATTHLFALRLLAQRVEVAGAASSAFSLTMLPCLVLLVVTAALVLLDLKRLVAALFSLHGADSSPYRRATWIGLGLSLSLALAGCTAAAILSWRAFRQYDGNAGQASAHDAFYALRDTDLTRGLSPALPVLLSLLGIICWQRGRMARLALASRAATLEAPELAAPISSILFPSLGAPAARSLVAEERLLNASVVRTFGGFAPGTAAFAVPFLLIALRGPNTLEAGATHVLLLASLALCAGLIGADWIALLRQEWGLRRLVDGLLSSHFGDAVERPHGVLAKLARIDAARESLSFAVCAEAHERLRGRTPQYDERDSTPDDEAVPRRMVARAIEVSRALQGLASGARAIGSAGATDAWVRDAEAFVAAVVCLLVRRHGQVFDTLQRTIVACTCLLLSASVFYPFGWRSTLPSELALVTLALFLLARYGAERIRSRFGASGRAAWNEARGSLVTSWLVLGFLLLFCAHAFLDGAPWRALFPGGAPGI